MYRYDRQPTSLEAALFLQKSHDACEHPTGWLQPRSNGNARRIAVHTVASSSDDDDDDRARARGLRRESVESSLASVARTNTKQSPNPFRDSHTTTMARRSLPSVGQLWGRAQTDCGLDYTSSTQ